MLKSPLREEPRSQRAGVIPSRNESSLLYWLESSGRMIPRDVQEPEYPADDEEEISGLIDVEDVTYDLDDDEDLVDIDEE